MTDHPNHRPPERRVDDLLDAALGAGTDQRPTVGAERLAAGARRRAGQIRRRRSAAATALGTGALVVLTFLAVPALQGTAAPDDQVAATVTEDASPEPSTSTAASAAPSEPAPSPVPTDTGPAAAEPLERTPDGWLLVPDEVVLTKTETPPGFDAAIADYPYPGGAFLQNVVPACTEASGPGSSGQPGGAFLGSRTWTHPGPQAAGGATSADVRVDLFADGGADEALQVLTERAVACGQADLGLGVVPADRPDGVDDYLVVEGGTPGVDGTPEVATPSTRAALVVARAGDVVVRVVVSTYGDDAPSSGPTDLAAAEQLVVATLDSLARTRTAERLAASS